MKKSILLVIMGILVILIIGYIFFGSCDFRPDFKPHTRNPYCHCLLGGQKESYTIMCDPGPCKYDGTLYRCRYFECKINSDCPSGRCSGNGKCIK